MKSFVSDRNDFVLDSLLYFEPVKGLQNRRNMMKFRSSGDSTSSSIENKLKTICLCTGEIKKKRITIVEFRMNKRSRIVHAVV